MKYILILLINSVLFMSCFNSSENTNADNNIKIEKALLRAQKKLRENEPSQVIESGEINGYRYFIVSEEQSKYLLVENFDYSTYNRFELYPESTLFLKEQATLATVTPKEQYSNSITISIIDVIRNEIKNKATEGDYSYELEDKPGEHPLNYLTLTMKYEVHQEYGPNIRYYIDQAKFVMDKGTYWFEDNTFLSNSPRKSLSETPNFSKHTQGNTINGENIISESGIIFDQSKIEKLGKLSLLDAYFTDQNTVLLVAGEKERKNITNPILIIYDNINNNTSRIRLDDYFKYKDDIQQISFAENQDSKVNIIIWTSNYDYDFSINKETKETETVLRADNLNIVYRH